MKNTARFSSFIVICLSIAFFPSGGAIAKDTSRTFPETGKTVTGRFLEYWEQNGGLAQQGLPISEEMQEKSDTDGKSYTVQYFERAVFEAHPENQKPNDVLLALLGTFRFQEKYKGQAQGDTITLSDDKAPTSSCAPTQADDSSPTYREDTPVRSSVGKGHVITGYVLSSRDCAPIAGAMLEMWPDVGNDHPADYRATIFTGPDGKYSFESPMPDHIHMRIRAHGYTGIFNNQYHPRGQTRGNFDIALSPDRTCTLFPQTGRSVCGRFLQYWEQNRGLAQQGYPISGELQETSELDDKSYTVQYFERAVFELHRENRPPYDVLLSQLGTLRYKAKDSSAGSTAGSVRATGVMSIARSCHTATLLPNGKVLIAGGMLREGQYQRSSELYDPATGTFSPTGSMAVVRASHTATLLPNGKVLVVGGALDGYAAAELYDPATGAFTRTGNINELRDGHTATLLNDGRVLITGGFDFSRRTGRATAELYDPATGRFTLTGSMSKERSAHTATLLPNGKVLVVGGGIGRNVLDSAELYDPVTGSFSPAGTMPTPRHKHSATLLASGLVLIAGGSDNRDWNGRYTGSLLYNPATALFTPAAEMGAERFKLRDAVTALPDGTILVAGSATLVEIYDPTTGRFTPTKGSLDTERLYQTATTLPDGSVLIVGGYDNKITSTTKAWIFAK